MGIMNLELIPKLITPTLCHSATSMASTSMLLQYSLGDAWVVVIAPKSSSWNHLPLCRS